MLSPDFQPSPPLPNERDYRKVPHNLEVEQALLGALLVDNSALERVPDSLTDAHFFDPLHGEIFTSIQQVVAAGRLASPITLRDLFQDRMAIQGLTVAQYLGTLASKAVSLINVPEYAKTIRDLSARRALIVIGEDMVAAAFEGAIDLAPSLIIEDVEASLLSLVENGPKGNEEIVFTRAVEQAIQRASDAYKRGGGLRGLSTGLVDLDAKLGGLAPSDLIIIGGRPGIGKTALSTTIAINVALEHMKTGGRKGAPVHFFSQEMSAEQLATRILAQHSQIPSDQIGRGTINEQQFSKMAEIAELIREAPFVVDQTGGLSLAQLTSRARRMKRRLKTGLIVVDYLQLMYGSAKENRTQDLTRITNGLKALAKELNVPIIALSQLSRQVENREEKRPTLSDLRESGSIEQDADIVMFVFREEYYVELRKPGDGDIEKTLEWQAELDKVKGRAEAILAKHRHGPTGTVNLAFNSQLTAFSNLAKDYQMPERYR